MTWQIVPEVLPKLLGGPNVEGRERATKAMLSMVKFDIKRLRDAYAGK